ncbi:hypothetical protein Nepgr_002047 [Nepenthes gracilis]|uniref:Uncharacterized protein n=1 Tax=Nepenthes gracilis TaxID=150966 RepID=A0AAD3P689_NEPGR|nr:hypothetical protein Nepgr_002047 [Nepenthes gracilis]
MVVSNNYEGIDKETLLAFASELSGGSRRSGNANRESNTSTLPIGKSRLALEVGTPPRLDYRLPRMSRTILQQAGCAAGSWDPVLRSVAAGKTAAGTNSPGGEGRSSSHDPPERRQAARPNGKLVPRTWNAADLRKYYQ